MSKLYLSIVLLFSISSYADFNDCKNLYVGRISVNDGGIPRAVFLTNPGNSSGSYWVFFSNYSESGRGSALSVLMAAKLSGHRLDLYTSGSNSCDIATGSRQAADLHLSNFK